MKVRAESKIKKQLICLCTALLCLCLIFGSCRTRRQETDPEPQKSVLYESTSANISPTPSLSPSIRISSGPSSILTPIPSPTPSSSTIHALSTTPANVSTTAPTIPAESDTPAISPGNEEHTISPHPVQTPEASTIALKVIGTRLTDQNGKPIVLKGISTHGISWFPEYVNEYSINQLKEQWGANCIRLAMYTAEYNGYCTGSDANRIKLKQLIYDGIKYATENNMYVIIDWHILSDGNPNTYLNQAKQFFSEMSEKYAGYNNILYEICNEPNGGTSWEQIKKYAEQIIPVIRRNDPDAVIIVGTPNWCQYLAHAAEDPITGFDNIMYALHFYAATHTDSLRQEMVAAIRSGLPVFVSEFGICDASGSGRIDDFQASKWLDLLDQYAISRIAWNLSNKNETSSVISSDCQKKYGWKYEELSDSGKWLFNNMFNKTSYIPPEYPPEQDDNTASPKPEIPPQEETYEKLENAAYKISVVNSWESDGKKYIQYSLIIINDSGKTCSGWSVNIIFDNPMTVISGWNGDFNMLGNTLTVTSKDYNKKIPAHEQLDGIGFIVHD